MAAIRQQVLLGTLASLCVAIAGDSTKALMSLAHAPSAVVPARMTRLPLRFEANAGQWDPRVRFATRSGGATLYLTGEGATVVLCAHSDRAERRAARRESDCSAVDLALAGGEPSPPSGESLLETKSNYFIGNDPTQWRTNVPNYAGVRSSDTLRGVDVVWHGREGALEYDLQVAAGVDARAIAFVIGGAKSLNITDDGSLEIATRGGTLTQRPPRVIQNDRELVARYRIDGTHIAFELDHYDTSTPVLIDPMLVYSTYLGGTGAEAGKAIAVDGAGAAYVVGSTKWGGFPTTTSAYQTKYTSSADTVFVSKLDPSGSSLVYSTYLGGNVYDEGLAIAVDATGSAYITGGTESANFPVTQGAYQTVLKATGSAPENAFVTKLAASGAALDYSTYLGGSTIDEAHGIAISDSGEAYVTGETLSTDFPTTKGAYRSTYSGGSGDAFVTKVDASGASLVYSTFLGGMREDYAAGIAVTNTAAYVVGRTYSDDFPTTAGAFQISSKVSYPGPTTAFVTKLDSAGASLLYSTYLGGGGHAWGVAVDSNGNAYVAGAAESDFPTTDGAYRTSCNMGGAVVTKLAASGSSLAYSTFVSCGGDDIYGIALAGGKAYVTGETTAMAFPTTPGAFQTTKPADDLCPFVTQLDPSGSLLVYSTYLGGSATEHGNGIALDSNGDAYVTGVTMSTDFPTTSGAVQTSNGGPADAFVAKLTQPKLPTATACTLAEQCASGQCIDGVCCDVACSGQCEACDVAGHAGTCTPTTGAPHGSRSACDACGACDGTNVSSCTERSEAVVCGTTCCSVASTCDPNGACRTAQSGGCSCDTVSSRSLQPWSAALLVLGGACLLARRLRRTG